MPTAHLLDYVAGNVRSLVNAINKVGYEVEWIKSPSDVKDADVSLTQIAHLPLSGYTHFAAAWKLTLVLSLDADTARSRSFRPLPFEAF